MPKKEKKIVLKLNTKILTNISKGSYQQVKMSLGWKIE